MIRSLDLSALRDVVAELLAAPPRDMRGALQQWADGHDVRIS
jgi:phosphotransferase system enzyme I (PtsP)